MTRLYNFADLKSRAKKIILYVSIAAALVAAVCAYFFAKEIAGLLLPCLAETGRILAAAGVMAHIKLGLFCFCLLSVPFFLNYTMIFTVNFSGTKEGYKQKRNWWLGWLAFYVFIGLALLLPPFYSDALIALDGAAENLQLGLYYRLNVVLGCGIGAQLLLGGILYGLRRKDSIELFKRIRIAASLIVGVIGIFLGFYLPLIMMMAIYLPAYTCLEIGRLLGGYFCRRQDSQVEKQKAAEPVIGLRNLSGSIEVLGLVAKPQVYAIGDKDSIEDVLEQAGLLEGKEPSFVIIGGEIGTIVDKSRFGQLPAVFEMEKPTMEVYCAFDCPVNIVAELLDKSYARFGKLGALPKLRKAMLAAREGKQDYKALVQLIEEEERQADTPSRKAVLRLPASLLRCFPEVLQEHCDYGQCRFSACDQLFDKACSNICPTHNDIQSLIDTDAEAIARVRTENPFMLSACLACEEKLCSALCRHRGNAGFEPAELIAELGAAALESFSEVKPAADGKRIAVIGAGVGGMTAAARLRNLGYQVKLFEKEKTAGGTLKLLSALYPQFGGIIEAEKKAALQGIELAYEQELGKDIKAQELLREFDAVLISIGAGKRKGLFAPGEEHGLLIEDFLCKPCEYEPEGRSFLLTGSNELALVGAERVLTGGAESLKVLLPSVRTDKTPWLALQEKYPRLELLSPKLKVNSIHLTESGGIHAALRENYSANALLADIDVDYLLIASDYSCDMPLLSANGVSVSTTGARIDAHNCAANNEGLFATGACAKYPLGFTQVIAEGLKAAEGIHAYLLPNHTKKGGRAYKNACSSCSKRCK